MEITLTINGKNALMKIDGSITGDQAMQLGEKFNEVLASDATVLELDFSSCRNINSSGIGKLLIFYKEFMAKGGEMEVTKSSQTVYDIFSTIKLNQLFTVNK